MAIGGAHPVRPLVRHEAAVAGEQMKFDAARREALVVFPLRDHGDPAAARLADTAPRAAQDSARQTRELLFEARVRQKDPVILG